VKALILKAISCSGFAIALLGFVACSSSSNGNPVTTTTDSGASSDAASSDSAAPVASCDGGAGGNLCTSAPSCNTTVNGACTVTTVAGTGALPTFTGGSIADGTYFLTGATAYGSPETVGQTQRITMTFTGGAFTLVQDSDVGCNSAPSGSGTSSTSGNQLTLSLTCPAADSEPSSYTATSTTFSYTEATGSSGTVFVFTRQQ
jgi:hypothetical protein